MNIPLESLAETIHANVHTNEQPFARYDEDDVFNACVILHAIVMDVSAPKLLAKHGQAKAEEMARLWGGGLHDMILNMTGVDTHERTPPEVHQ